MDIYSSQQVNDYDLVMLNIHSKSLQSDADRAAAFYITDNIIRHRFLKDIDDLCSYARSICADKLVSKKENLI